MASTLECAGTEQYDIEENTMDDGAIGGGNVACQQIPVRTRSAGDITNTTLDDGANGDGNVACQETEAEAQEEPELQEEADFHEWLAAVRLAQEESEPMAEMQAMAHEAAIADNVLEEFVNDFGIEDIMDNMSEEELDAMMGHSCGRRG